MSMRAVIDPTVNELATICPLNYRTGSGSDLVAATDATKKVRANDVVSKIRF
jgi:hypothetical protein